MTPSPLIRRNAVATVRRFRALLCLLAIGAAALVMTSAVVGNAVTRTADALDTESALAVVEADSVSPRGDSRPLTSAAMEQIRALDGVQEVLPYGQVLLPDRYRSERLNRLVGHAVTLQYTQATGPSQGKARDITLTVAGVYDNSHPARDGESAVYVSEALSRVLLAASAGARGGDVSPGYAFPTVFVKTTSATAAGEVQDELTAQGYYAQGVGNAAQDLPRLLALASHMDRYLAIGLTLFCLGVGLSVAGTWARLRRWDVGLLTALGWSRAAVLAAFIGELALVGLVVGVCAVTVGVAASSVVAALLPTGSWLGVELSGAVVLPPYPWLLAVVVGVPAALTAGATPRVIRLTALDPETALRRRD